VLIGIIYIDISLSFLINLYIGKSLDPEGTKVGEEEESTNSFDVARFTSLYEHHGLIPLTREELSRFIGVEENLFYLISLTLENDQSLLDEDFIDQVMNQFNGQPEEMMRYVEGVISERKSVEVVDDIEPPPLYIADGSPPPAIIEIENGVEDDMDTTRDEGKRKRRAITRLQSKNDVLALGN
jgi:hypothetical protein